MAKHVKHKNPGIASVKIKSAKGGGAGKGKGSGKVTTVGHIP